MREACELDAETIRLQQEAEDRVRRMRERSRRLVLEHDDTAGNGPAVEMPPVRRPSPPPPPTPVVPNPAVEATGNGTKPDTEMKNEQILLLLLAVFLLKNGGRMELILALLYLAM